MPFIWLQSAKESRDLLCPYCMEDRNNTALFDSWQYSPILRMQSVTQFLLCPIAEICFSTVSSKNKMSKNKNYDLPFRLRSSLKCFLSIILAAAICCEGRLIERNDMQTK